VSRRKKIRKHYEPRIHPRREGFRVADWATAASQAARFQVLVDNIDLAGSSLLDVGCGPGDLWKFLSGRGVAARYTGVDILPKMVAEAQRRCPGVRFVVGDVLAGEAFENERFDVVFCSGAFNLELGNNREFLAAALRRLLAASGRWIVFNLLHVRARRPDSSPAYHYYDPQDVLELLEPLACRARIVDDYLHNDFTVICEKTAEGAT
jgi:SAM-dependent methyltransferase